MDFRRLRYTLVLIGLALFLNGCMYPNDRKLENQLPPMQQVALVQEGINKFQSDTGVLPILTKEADTPIYEKYVIDFKKMVPRYIPYIPGGAFEKGGASLFVLTDVETKPTVRLLDLRLSDQVSEIQTRVTYFFRENKYLPVAGVVKPGYFSIDYKRIGYSGKPVTVESPYTGKQLPVIMSAKGIVGIDYRNDLITMINNNHIKAASSGDLRSILADNSIYVPVKSFPYRLVNGSPELSP